VIVAEWLNVVQLLATADALDLGGGVAQLEGWSGDIPASTVIAPSGILLFTLDLLKPSSFLAVDKLSLLFDVPPLAVATGYLSYCRLKTASAQVAAILEVGLLSSTAPVRVTTRNVTIGLPVSIRAGFIS
jgi:hypothetical protein